MRKVQIQGGFVSVDDDAVIPDLPWVAYKFFNMHYATAGVWDKQAKKMKTLYMHRMLLGEIPKGMHVDHIDRNGLNNTRENLRIVTPQENQRNLDPNKKTNNSGYRGVHLLPHGKWRAHITTNGRTKSLGNFASFEEAKAARIEGEKTFWHNRPTKLSLA